MYCHAVGDAVLGITTVWIAGDAVFTCTEELRTSLFGALDGCRHLVIDISLVADLDATFRVVVCSLHRRAYLSRRRVSLKGTLGGSAREPAPHRVAGCPFHDSGAGCLLWESPPRQRCQPLWPGSAATGTCPKMQGRVRDHAAVPVPGWTGI